MLGVASSLVRWLLVPDDRRNWWQIGPSHWQLQPSRTNLGPQPRPNHIHLYDGFSVLRSQNWRWCVAHPFDHSRSVFGALFDWISHSFYFHAPDCDWIYRRHWAASFRDDPYTCLLLHQRLKWYSPVGHHCASNRLLDQVRRRSDPLCIRYRRSL